MSHRTWNRRAVLVLLHLGLCACGGSGDGGGGGATPVNLANFQAASDIIGQAAATGMVANNGAGSGLPNQIGLDQPLGHVGNGSLYVCDTANHRILGWNSPPSGLGQPADFVLGQTLFTTQVAGTISPLLNQPSSCWVAGGTLFVADASNGRVLLYGGPPTSNVAATIALGKPDVNTNGATGGQAGLSNISLDVCVAANRIVVADTGNNRVMIWNGIPGASGSNADVVLGQNTFATNSPGLSLTQMSGPTGVWTDGTRLVVADSTNNRVLVWATFPTANGQAPDFIVGQPNSITGTPGNGTQKFSSPASVASDGVQLFVADRSNSRVLIFSPFPTADNPVATGVLGQNSFTNVIFNDDDQNSVPDANPTARTMASPAGVTVVGNRLYVQDVGNHRILVFTGS
jgi:hypothetical protein